MVVSSPMPAHSRKSKSSSSGGGSSSSSLPYTNTSADSALTSTLTPQLYLQRMTDLQQMDLQSAIDQMRILLTLYPQRVYKMAYYRKQTKNHWARDDPAFCFLQISMIAAVSIAYGFAFRVGSFLDIIAVVTKSVLVNWLGFGVIIASVGRLIANNHLMMAERSSSHVKQEVEWLYAFDVHCNAFVPLFVLLCELPLCVDVFSVSFHKFSCLSVFLYRWSATLLVTGGTWAISPLAWSFQHIICNSFRVVLLYYSFGLSSITIPFQYRGVFIPYCGCTGTVCFQLCWISFWTWFQCI